MTRTDGLARLELVLRRQSLRRNRTSSIARPMMHSNDCRAYYPDYVPVLTFPRFPDTNTTSTAEYAAVAAKIASRLALVVTLSPTVNATIKTITRASLAFGLATK